MKKNLLMRFHSIRTSITVSYTHLDVYKRQPKARAASSTSTPVCFFRSPDVYKRQLRN